MKRLLPYLVAALPAITSAQVDTFHASFKDLNGKALPNVSILPYEGSPVIFTGNDQGLVTIPKYPAKTYEYRLTTKKSEPHNGLDVQDLVLLEALITGNWKPNQPIHELAADLDQSKSVNAEDLKLLTSSITNGSALDFLSGVYGWRFLPANTALSPSNPFNNLPEATDLSSLKGVVRVDMLGYKVGDLNGDARPEKLQSGQQSSRGAGIQVLGKDEAVAAGNTTSFMLTMPEGAAGYGLSMVLNSTDALELIAVESAEAQLLKTQETQVGNKGQKGVYLGFQSSAASIAAGKPLIKVTVKARTNVRLSDVLTLDPEQSYWIGGTLPRFEKQAISLEWEGLPTAAPSNVSLPLTLNYQQGATIAQLQFPAMEGAATVRMVQANGQVICSATIAPGATQHQLEVGALASGLYWIQVVQGQQQGSIALVKP